MLYEESKGDAIITTGVGQHQMWAAQVRRLALGVHGHFFARWLGGDGCRAACWLHTAPLPMKAKPRLRGLANRCAI